MDAKFEAKLEGVEAKIEGEFKALHSEIARLGQKADSVDIKLSTRINAMDEKNGQQDRRA